MLTKLKWIVYILIFGAIAAGLHWSLPQRDVVRITGHEIKRVDVETQDEAGASQKDSRDVSFMYAAFLDGDTISYRNEDTDWSWPPYLKFDTSDISSRASNLISSKDDPRWVIVTHYGWRIQILSMFENVVNLEEVEDPNQSLIPWFNIIVVAALLIVFLLIRRYVLLLYGRHVDPLVDSIDEQWDGKR